MNAFTKLSGKGQVVVPKSTRDRLGWAPGTELEVVESADMVTLRRRKSGGSLKVDEALAKLRRLYRHDGPPVPIEKLGWHAEADDDSTT